FNINENEIVKFIQQSSDSAVLNRVLGGSISQILGTLQSNGKVFIVNPAGIVFGANSTVDVGSLVASTLDITNEDFLNGNYVFNQDKDKAIAQILTQGVIKVNDDGTLALVGGQVINTGVLEAKNGSVYLLAGQSITIQDLDNPLISYKVTAENKAVNLGEIVSKRATLLGNKVANGYTSASEFSDIMSNYATSATNAKINADGEIVLYGASVSDEVQTTAQTDSEVTGTTNSLVINNGTLNASNASGKGGTVKVLGDNVVLESNSVINASGQEGGEVYVGGDFQGNGSVKLANTTIVESGSVVDASGTTGNGGNIAVWGNYTYVDGSFLATSVAGKGGFLETSGKYITVADNISVNTSSQLGKSYYGNWLIDPVDLSIVNGSSTSVSGSWWYSGYTDYAGSKITDTTINNQLKSTSVTIAVSGNISITNAYIYTLSGNNNYLTIYTTGGGYNITNSTFNFGGNGTLTLTGYANFSVTNTTINVNSLVLGSGNGLTYTADDKYWLNISKSNITVRGSNGSSAVAYIRANAYASSSVTDTNITVENGTLDFRYNANLTFNNSNLTAESLILQANPDALNIDGVTTTLANSSVNVTKSLVLNNTRSSLNIENTTINGSDTATITSSVKSLNVTDNSSISGNVVSLSTTDGDVSVSNSSVTSETNTTLNAVGGNVTFDSAKVGVTEGVINICATNNVTLTDTVTLEMTNSSDLNVYGGNYATVSNVSLDADTLTIGGGNVTVENTSLNAKSNLSVTGCETVSVTNTTAESCANLTVASTNGTTYLQNASLTAGDSVSLTAKENLTLDNHTFVNATGSVLISSSNASTTVEGSNVTAGNVTLSANDTLTVNNSNISGSKGLSFNSNNSDVNLAASSYATGDNANFTVTAGGNATVDATTANYTFGNGTNLTVKAAGNATVSNLDINTANVVLEGGNVTSTNNTFNGIGEFTVNATNNATLENTKVNATNVNVTAGENATLTNGTIINSTGNASVVATNGSTVVEGSNITAANVALSANDTLTVNNSNISGAKSLSLNANKSDVNVAASALATGEDANFTVTAGGNATVNATGVNLGNGTDLTVKAGNNAQVSNFNYNSGNVSVDGANVTLTNNTFNGTGTFTVNASSDATLTDTHVNATEVSVAANGTANVSDSSFNATAGNATFTAGDDLALNNTTVNATANITATAGDSLSLGNGTILTAAENATIKAVNGSATVEGTNVTANNVDLSANEALTVNNSNISGTKAVTLNSNTADVDFTNGTLATGENANFTVTAGGNATVNATGVSLGDGTDLTVTAGNNAQVSNFDYNSGNVSVEGTNVTLTNNTFNGTGTFTVNASSDATLTDTHVNATEVSVEANGTLNATDSSFNATAGNATFTAGDDLALNNTTVNATANITAIAGDNLSLGNGTILTAAENATIKAVNGSATVEGTNVTANNVVLSANEALTVNNSNISGTKAVTLNSNTADVDFTDGKLSTGENANFTVTAGGNATVNATGVSLGDGTDLTVTAGNNAQVSNFNYNSGNVSVAGTNVTLTNNTFNSTGKVEITSEESTTLTDTNVNATDVNLSSNGSTTVTNSTLEARDGYANVTSKEDTTIESSNISGNQGVNIVAENGTT
ncbi:beta strand repeat-containing protein, partial [Psittacicella gerlachiana]